MVLCNTKTFINFKHLSTVRMFISARMPLLIILSFFFLKAHRARYLIDKLTRTRSHRRRGELHTHMSFTGEEHDGVVNQIARRARPVRWAKALPILFRFSPRSPKETGCPVGWYPVPLPATRAHHRFRFSRKQRGERPQWCSIWPRG